MWPRCTTAWARPFGRGGRHIPTSIWQSSGTASWTPFSARQTGGREWRYRKGATATATAPTVIPGGHAGAHGCADLHNAWSPGQLRTVSSAPTASVTYGVSSSLLVRWAIGRESPKAPRHAEGRL